MRLIPMIWALMFVIENGFQSDGKLIIDLMVNRY